MHEAMSIWRAGRGLSQSPLWADLLDGMVERISGRRRIWGPGSVSLEGMGSIAARAHARLLVALESWHVRDLGSELVCEAEQLLVAVARVGACFGTSSQDGRVWLADQLGSRLGSHEDAVLAAEVTYSVWAEQAELSAAQMRRAISQLSRDASNPAGEMLLLRRSAVELGSLLVRLAANARASGCACWAPLERSDELQVALDAIATELAARAQAIEPLLDDHADRVAAHLAGGLRLRLSRSAVRGLDAASTGAPALDAGAMASLRDSWLGLATTEYAAVTLLDAQLAMPAAGEQAGSPSQMLVDSAASVICGARLLDRPGAFRHARAWERQAVALTYALEHYVAGVSGHAPGLAQARRVVLARLVRAVVAVTMIDLTGDAPGLVDEPGR